MPSEHVSRTKERPRNRKQAAAEPRLPQQERGQRRVDCILDAAGALIAEEGVRGATMHRVAQRSDTTIGSMYHFFPKCDTLLRTLVGRHAQELLARVAQTERNAAGRWADLSTAEVVGQFLDPFLGYVDEHPDVLPLMRFSRTASWAGEQHLELDRVVLRLARALVMSRNPWASADEAANRAVAIAAMAEGVMYAAGRTTSRTNTTLDASVIRNELRRALVAYLDSYAMSLQAEPVP